MPLSLRYPTAEANQPFLPAGSCPSLWQKIGKGVPGQEFLDVSIAKCWKNRARGSYISCLGGEPAESTFIPISLPQLTQTPSLCLLVGLSVLEGILGTKAREGQQSSLKRRGLGAFP